MCYNFHSKYLGGDYMKKSVVALGLMSALLLAGCSNGNASTSNNDNNTKSSSVAKKDKAVSYQDLTSNKKKNVKFNVTKDKDEDDNSADLSLTIKNNTNKDIKFNQAKFSLMADGDKKAISEKTGTIVVRAGHKGTIDELFDDVSTDVLNSTNLSIQYLNSDNVVAKPDLAEKNETSDNTQNVNNNNDQTNTNTNSTQTNDSTNTDNSAQQQTDNRVVKRADQAEDLFRRAYGDWAGGLSVQQADGGWQVTQDGDPAGFVDNDGNITASNGTTTSYQDMLTAPQNGGPVKP